MRWALRTAVNKSSRYDEIPAELFKTVKDDAIKVLHSLCMSANSEDPAVATKLEKVNTHPSSHE